MKQFDLISDTHIDFWVHMDTNSIKMENKLRDFVKELLPNEPSDVLVIAGDLGHYNNQNFMFLQILKETYSYILLVEGNHDLYMISNKMKEKYENNSLNRIREMKEIASQLKGVYYLDGNIVEIDGIKFGGTGMWYDFSYGVKVMGLSREKVFEVWEDRMNDSVYIKGIENRPNNRFSSEIEKLEKFIYDSDVIVTHVGPDWSRIPAKYQDDICTSFYYFDGTKYFQSIEGKIWCFGHTHDRYNYMNYGCWFVNASLGYPKEVTNKGIRKIVNIPL